MRSKFVSAVLAASLLMSGAAFAASQSHDHGHGHAADQQLQLDHGRKWHTDAALRQGMERIRSDFATNLSAIHNDKLTSDQYASLADRINDHVQYIVNNCKLEPKADAQLHIVLGEVMAGTGAMDDGQREQGAVTLMKALNAYGEHFDHPGWQPVGH